MSRFKVSISPAVIDGVLYILLKRLGKQGNIRLPLTQREMVTSINQLTGSSVFQLRGYKPVRIAAEIECPVLLVVPEDDKVCLPQGAMDVAAKAPLCELVTTEGR